MLAMFVVLAVLGIAQHRRRRPAVLRALIPHYARRVLPDDRTAAFLALGSVVLAVTGAEALYADMGHFGRKPIRISWLCFVLPGADAQLPRPGRAAARATRDGDREPVLPARARMGSAAAGRSSRRWPTVIASQAVISGAFSVTQQAIQLGFMPAPADHAHHRPARSGQIYIPVVNWALMIGGDPAGAGLPHLVATSPRPTASR